jgi:hypothetical protein
MELFSDTFYQIATFLDAQDLNSFSLVNSEINQICNEQEHWQRLFTKRLSTTILIHVMPSHLDEPIDYKALYKQVFTQSDFTGCQLRAGTFNAEMATYNIAGNKTVSNGEFKFHIGMDSADINATVAYGSGDEYNDACQAVWTGNWNACTVTIKEKYGSHNGYFIYTGTVKSLDRISGDYYWDIKPTAVGTFDLSFNY